MGCFEDIDFKEKSYDVILLFHVLEHLENPVEDIKRLKRFLKENGTFIIEVPNVTHRQGFPTAKWHIGHLYNFNKTTLAATAAKAAAEDAAAKKAAATADAALKQAADDARKAVEAAEKAKKALEKN